MCTLLCRGLTLACFVLAGAAFLHWGGLGIQADDKKDAGSEDQRPNTLTEQEKAAGWKLLFDGKTADGWRAYRGKKMPDNAVAAIMCHLRSCTRSELTATSIMTRAPQA